MFYRQIQMKLFLLSCPLNIPDNSCVDMENHKKTQPIELMANMGHRINVKHSSVLEIETNTHTWQESFAAQNSNENASDFMNRPGKNYAAKGISMECQMASCFGYQPVSM